MKKLLGIVVLGFILVGCGTTESLVINEKIYKGMTKKELMKTFTWTNALEDLNLGIGFERYFADSKEEILSNRELTVYYIFTNVNNPGIKGDGILKKWDPSEALALESLSAKSKEEIKNEEKKKEEEEKDKEQVQLTGLIDKAKNTCKTIGYKEDTEKFTDCTFDIYTQNIELAAEKNQTIVQSSGLSGGSVTIYDPVRDNNALIKRGQGLINGTCTLGDLSTC